MPQNKALRYTMFCSLYFTQGMILSYFTALNALYFLSRGLSMTDVGIFASIALIPFVIAGANQLVNPFLQKEFGISLSQAGYYATVWGIGVVLGGVFGGRIYSKIGMKNATWAAMGVGLAGILLLAFTASPGMAWPLVALFGLAYGTQNTVYFALAMKCTDPRIAASMFSILMVVTNVAQGAGMGISGVLSDSAGFHVTFVVLAFLNILVIPLMPVIFGGGKTRLS